MADSYHVTLRSPLAPSHARDDRVVLRRWLSLPAWMLFGGLALAYGLGLTLPERWVFVPFIASLLFLGLPHGAVDHIVLLKLRREPLSVGGLTRVILPYLAIGGAYLMLWWIAPLAAFLGFIALTWFHWGQGDLHSLLWLTQAAHLPTRAHRALAVFVRGGLPMLVPLVAFPDIYTDIAAATMQAVQPGSSAAMLQDASLRLALSLGYGLALLGYIGWTYRAARRAAGLAAWREDIAEVAVLLGFFALVHPVLAVGLYFCCWHAARHMARLLVYEQMPFSAAAHTVGLPRPSLGTLVRRLTLHAWPTTLAAMMLLGALYLWVPLPPGDLTAWLGLYLVLIAVLTLPHVWVVLQMDRREAVWDSTSANLSAPSS